MSRTRIERIVVAILVAGFAIGTTTHLLHLLRRGWIVFEAAPAWMNLYWAALTAIDPCAALLLWLRRPAGLALGTAIIVSDVAINSYALYGLALPVDFLSLRLQTLFCGLLLGATAFLQQPARTPPSLRSP